MLGDRALDDRNIFVRWVKEGRKYGLGCILVTQQPGAISKQIISQGDNFFVCTCSTKATCKRSSATTPTTATRFSASFATSRFPVTAISGAPQPAVRVSARVADFESVCQKAQAKPQPASLPIPKNGALHAIVAESVLAALQTNPRVWLYRVAAFSAEMEPGWIACSVDYLRSAVASALSQLPEVKNLDESTQWLQQTLPDEVTVIMRERQARSGYAVLQGVTRQVWALRETELRLAGGKRVQAATIEIRENL